MKKIYTLITLAMLFMIDIPTNAAQLDGTAFNITYGYYDDNYIALESLPEDLLLSVLKSGALSQDVLEERLDANWRGMAKYIDELKAAGCISPDFELTREEEEPIILGTMDFVPIEESAPAQTEQYEDQEEVNSENVIQDQEEEIIESKDIVCDTEDEPIEDETIPQESITTSNSMPSTSIPELEEAEESAKDEAVSTPQQPNQIPCKDDSFSIIPAGILVVVVLIVLIGGGLVYASKKRK